MPKLCVKMVNAKGLGYVITSESYIVVEASVEDHEGTHRLGQMIVRSEPSTGGVLRQAVAITLNAEGKPEAVLGSKLLPARRRIKS